MKFHRNDSTANNPYLKYNYSNSKIGKKSCNAIMTHSIRSDECKILDKIFDDEILCKEAQTNGNEELDFWKISDDGKVIERQVPVDETNTVITEESKT